MGRQLRGYVVADPAICNGQLTFRGTRILVADVLEQVATGRVWESIIEDSDGELSKEAIQDAVRLARRVLAEQPRPSLPEARQLGGSIVADSRICHGQPTFRGTRILVDLVLEHVADGTPWWRIVEEWGNRVSKEWVQDAVNLARKVLLEHSHEFLPETVGGEHPG
jgi:uncharacterized protein (DUF433 family)